MNFDELKSQWAAQNQKMENSLRLNVELLRADGARKASGALARVTGWIWLELIVNFAAMLLLGNFIAARFHELRFLVPAILLDLFAVSLIFSSIRQLAVMGQVDFDAPLLISQKNLETLRIQRLRATKWISLLAPLLWTPLLIVAFKGIWGIDAYAVFPAAWLLTNLLAGFALLGAMLWAAHRFAPRARHSPFMQRLLDDIAGRNLTAAQAALARLSAFEREADAPEF